jgi:hypothetical protein
VRSQFDSQRRPGPRWRIRKKHSTVLAALVAGALVLVAATPFGVSAAPATQSLFPVAVTPSVLADGDTSAVELGVKFSPSVDGTISGIKFYKASQNTGTHTATLWNSSGAKLGTATFKNETASGWQTASFTNPPSIEAGQQYTASYYAPAGRYSATNDGFDAALTSGDLTAPVGAGVYRYGSAGLPTSTWKNTNYFVDVNFVPGTTPPAPTPTPTNPTTPPPAPGVTATLRQVDGGTDYYGKFSNGLPTSADYFPIGVWYESARNAGEVALDREVGINTYMELTDDSQFDLVTNAGSYMVPSYATNPQANGYLLNDEVDMGPGPGPGYTVMEEALKRVPPGMMSYANFGKGVTFWETDAEAAQFVSYPALVSADNYWFTDPNICDRYEGAALVGTRGTNLTEPQCRLAANYGQTVERVRELVSPLGSKPVWNFVEVGHPFTQATAPTITAPQIRAAVWSGIIHGARGTIYFNHNFGGDCISYHVLRESCGAGVRPTVMAVNKQVTELAPVLNSPFVDGLLTTNGTVDTAVKAYNGAFYVLAGSAQPAGQTVTFTNECTTATTATVLGENRTLPVSGGTFTDTFADGNAVHLYQLNGGTCGV